MGNAIEVVKDYLGDLTRLVRLGDPQTYKELTIVPLLQKEGQFLDMISLRKGEETNVAYVQERSGGASVSELEVVNQGSKPIMLPFMQTITGGQQDRTVIEPILVPTVNGADNSLVIPVRCIESGRWSTRMTPDLDIQQTSEDAIPIPQATRETRFRAAKMKTSPSLNYSIMEQSKSQSAVWDTIESYSSIMSVSAESAPSRSYLHMQRTKDSEIQEYSENSVFKDVEEQCGVVAIVGTQVVGMELYGDSKCWQDFREEVLNGYATEVLLRKDKADEPLNRASAHQTVLTAFDTEMSFTERAGTGAGMIVELHSSNKEWYGICLIHNNQPAHFYMAYRSVIEPTKPGQHTLQSAQLDRQIQQQVQFRPEIMSQMDPQAFNPEEEQINDRDK